MSAAFKKAAEDSKKLLAKPSNDELLELYGSYTASLSMSFATPRTVLVASTMITVPLERVEQKTRSTES